MTYRMAEILAIESGATGYEISYHSGHRPTHTFGGKQFTFAQMKTMGVEDMLNDYNCRHWKFPVIVGVTPPKYSVEELAYLEAAELVKHEWDGKEYTLYDLMQKKNEYNRKINKVSREITAFAALGDEVKEEKSKNILSELVDTFIMLTQFIGDWIADLFKPKSESQQGDDTFTPLEKTKPNDPIPLFPEPENLVYDVFQYNWTGEYITIEFLNKVIEIANLLKISPDDLMAIMAFESSFNPYIQNNASGATGLIQFTQIALNEIMRLNPEINITKNDLLNMSAIEQLDYVYLYYKPYIGKMNTLSDIYMVTLWPRAVGENDDYVLWYKGTIQYTQNAGLDINKDGKITKEEATKMVINRRETYEKK